MLLIIIGASLIMSEPYTYAKHGDFVYIYHAAVQNCNSYSNFTNACILLCIFMGGSGLATWDCSPLHKNGMCLALMTSLKWSSMYAGSCMSSALALHDKLECSSTRVKLLWWSLCICKVAILVSIIKAYYCFYCVCYNMTYSCFYCVCIVKTSLHELAATSNDCAKLQFIRTLLKHTWGIMGVAL